MRRFKGQFKNTDGSDTYVSITPSNNIYTETVNLKFTYEESVIISQVSDIIFTPVKTKSCTIKIFTDEIYFDLYTSDPTGYFVEVKVGTTSVFQGYLTPCVYTQDYAYKGELELEAVDFLAVCEQFKYNTISSEKGIHTVHDIILNAIKYVCPNYDYNDFEEKLSISTSDYYLQEVNFFDDEGEAMTIKEVLEEIAKFLGATFTMGNDGKIYLIDYDHIKDTTTPETLDTSKYAEGTPTVEMDEVYNNIEINDSLYEVEEDGLVYDLFDDDYSNMIVNGLKAYSNGSQLYSRYGYSWRQGNHHTQAKNNSKIWVKPYYFVDDDFVSHPVYNKSKQYIKGKWKTTFYNLSTNQLYSDQTIAQKFWLDTQVVEEEGYPAFYPQFKAVYPIRMYSDTYADATPISITWNDYLLFTNYNYEYWQNYIKNKTIDSDGLQRPVLEYSTDEFLPYSIEGGISWITFKGDLWYQMICDDKVHPYGTTDSGSVLYFPFPFDGISINSDITDDNKTMRSRLANILDNASIMNSGWELLKVKLQIGDKYFKGFQWNSTTKKYESKGWGTTETTFYIPYHDEDVSTTDTSAKEYMHYYNWIKPVTNTDYRDKVGEECFAIPILPDDKVSGRLKMTLYTPQIVHNLTTADDDVKSFGGGNPNMWMKGLEVSYKFTDDTHWADDVQVEDDIVYLKEFVPEIKYTNVKDDITLKINCWYYKKPISKSYILDEDYLPVAKIGTQPQEANLVDKYYSHYSTPKKILNLNYKEIPSVEHINKHHNSTNTDYMVDSYEYDVRTGNTQYKLIQL